MPFMNQPDQTKDSNSRQGHAVSEVYGYATVAQVKTLPLSDELKTELSKHPDDWRVFLGESNTVYIAPPPPPPLPVVPGRV